MPKGSTPSQRGKAKYASDRAKFNRSDAVGRDPAFSRIRARHKEMGRVQEARVLKEASATSRKLDNPFAKAANTPPLSFYERQGDPIFSKPSTFKRNLTARRRSTNVEDRRFRKDYTRGSR